MFPRLRYALPALFFAAVVLAMPTNALAEGRFQVEVGPPVVVLDTETGAVWVGQEDPVHRLVLKRVRYEDDNGTLRDHPPEE